MKTIAVITGGASGIGLACAERLGRAHDLVVLVDLGADRLAQAEAQLAAQGIAARGFECDVTDAAALTVLAGRIEADHGQVATLITSAGIINNTQTVMDMDLDEHARVWDVNYNGTVHAVRAFARAMITRRAGAILTLGSITGSGAFPLPAYSPSKTAIARLTGILAVELGRFGIRVNGVAPTYVLTANIEARIKAGERDADAIRTAGALEMFVRPEHIAEAAAFLCSESAAAITGAMLPVDAGWLAATTYRSYAGGLPWAKNGHQTEKDD